MSHSVEKIGGTSMSNYAAIRDNIVLQNPDNIYQRIFVVSAYAGITDLLLEHKKTDRPGIYALFASSDETDDWNKQLDELHEKIKTINSELFSKAEDRIAADAFIDERLQETRRCLDDLQRVCSHGHFELESHLLTVREMLASLGEAHSAWNTARLLQTEGVNARFVDISGWDSDITLPLDEKILDAFKDIDLTKDLPIVTGYTHCQEGLMKTFDWGYSEMTFSRIAVLTQAKEAIIHKEFHLSSADPRIVGADKVVPIGRTNYDVADQLANLGMEAIHPKAAKGLRQNKIPLRVKNTFEPNHEGTLITGNYISDKPSVEIIAGRKQLYAIELFDQDMMGSLKEYDVTLLETFARFKARIVTKDINANTITHYLDTNLKTIKRICVVLEEKFPSAEIDTRSVSVVSAIGSDMKLPGILSKTVAALADANISVLAMHQSMRQVDMQFIVDKADYENAIRSLHEHLVEIHEHEVAICAA